MRTKGSKTNNNHIVGSIKQNKICRRKLKNKKVSRNTKRIEALKGKIKNPQRPCTNLFI